MTTRMQRPGYLALACCLAATACGGGDDAANPDSGSNADAAAVADAGPDAAPACTELESSYGDLGSVTGVADLKPQDPDAPSGPMLLSLQIPLNQDATPDVLFVELWDESAPFDTGFAVGTFTITGNQADLVECGACVFISANHQQGGIIDHHMASSGTLTLDIADATSGTGQVKGSLSALRLRQVTVDQAGQMTVPGGCAPTIDAVAFDFTVAAAAAR